MKNTNFVFPPIPPLYWGREGRDLAVALVRPTQRADLLLMARLQKHKTKFPIIFVASMPILDFVVCIREITQCIIALS